LIESGRMAGRTPLFEAGAVRTPSQDIYAQTHTRSKDAAVTREHKLALIVGFSLVLIVGVLISDHFSPARTQDVSAGAMSAGTPVGFGSSPQGLRVPADPTSRPQLPDTLTSTHVANRLPEQPTYQPPVPAPQPVPPAPASQEVPANLPDATRPSGPTELVMGVPNSPANQIAEPLRSDFEPATGAIGERFAENAGRSIPGLGTSPIGPGAVLTKPVDQVAPPPANSKPLSSGSMKRHTIQEGDSIYRIAITQYGDGTLWSRLRAFNPGKIGQDGELRDGVVIELPPKDVLLGKAVLPSPGMKAPTTPASPSRQNPTATPAPGKIDSPQKRDGTAPGHTVYVVQRGDELGMVAKKMLGSVKRWPEIAALNKDVMSDPDTLTAGMKLRIPAR